MKLGVYMMVCLVIAAPLAMAQTFGLPVAASSDATPGSTTASFGVARGDGVDMVGARVRRCVREDLTVFAGIGTVDTDDGYVDNELSVQIGAARHLATYAGHVPIDLLLYGAAFVAGGESFGDLYGFTVGPTARLRLQAEPRVSVYGGGGISYLHSKHYTTTYTYSSGYWPNTRSRSSSTESETNFALWVGALFDMTEDMSVYAEAARNVDHTFLNIGLQFQL